MAKYADIEPFYDWLIELMRMDTSSHPDHNTLMFYEIMDTLDSLPEVVRCKDCAFYDRFKNADRDRGYCLKYGFGCMRIKKLDDFCSYGERREGE